MIENLYNESNMMKDKVLAILCYIWLFPLLIILVPKKTNFVKYHLKLGLILSVGITIWIIAILMIIKEPFNKKLLNFVNGILMLLLIAFEIFIVIRILRKGK